LMLICAAAFVVVAASLSMWLFTPVPRMAIAIAPVANQSGYTELDDYRLALTHTLSAALGESRTVRVTSYERLFEIIRRFALNGTDVSSREAIQAIGANSGAQIVVVPTLLYENRAWRGRAEFRSPETAINTAVYETVPVVSSLSKDTAYALMASLAEGIEQHFQNNAPAKVRLVEQLRSIAGRRAPAMMPKLRTLDAAAEFERGLSAYEGLQYANARRSFANAVERDPENPLAFAWLGHIEQILQGKAAQQAADHAMRLLTPQTPAIDALLVAAVSAEARGDYQTATARYRELAVSRPDDPTWLMELGSFQYRRSSWTDAVTSYRQALNLDSHLARPHLELCRLYNRLNESASAKDEGDRALAAYRALGNRSGEGQALMCMTDMLRVGTEAQRGEARRNAEAAAQIFDELGDPYNLARAFYYIALAAEAQGRLVETVSVYEKSLATAREAGNVPLEALDVMNLGAIYVKLGNYTRALEYYRQSQKLFEGFGDESRAAQGQANIGAILVEYGGRPDEGRRDLDNALAVFRKLGDKKFEVFVAKVTAAAHRYAGRHGDAELELNRALALAKERDMTREIATLTIDLAESRYDLGDYAGAETLLLRARGNGGGKDSALARIQLARTYVRLARFDEARIELDEASKEVQANGDKAQLPFLHQALGELAYESGRLREARTHFGDGAALWMDKFPEPSSVDARMYVGLLVALDGDAARGRATVESSVEQAQQAGPYSVEVRGRIFLARIDIATGRHEAALNTLNTIIPDSVSDRAIGPELQAQAHYWRSRAMLARGDGMTSASEASAARKLLQDLRTSVSEPYRDGFASRPDIRLILQQTR
jgi:tetratricopeptide (TPR) repeat protein